MKKETRLIVAFLVVIAAFVMIMIGIDRSEMGICRAALILMLGALLYTPLKDRIFVKKK